MYFNIRCKGRCYICNNPLEPYVKSNNWQVRDLVRHYRKTISPLYCYNNETFYKIYKLKAQRLCYSCFKNDQQKITPQQLRKRECGQYHYFNRVPSLSDKDIIKEVSFTPKPVIDNTPIIIEAHIIIEPIREICRPEATQASKNLLTPN